jgi:hypothetical protein
MSESSSRLAEFVVASTVYDPLYMADKIGLAPDKQTWMGKVRLGSRTGRPAIDNAWILVEAGNGATDVHELIHRLYMRLESAQDNIKQLVDDGCGAIFRVVLYLSSEDDVGPGFVLDRQLLEWVLNTGSAFEVDQYVLG